MVENRTRYTEQTVGYEICFLFAVQQTPMFALEIMRSYSDRIRKLRQSVSND